MSKGEGIRVQVGAQFWGWDEKWGGVTFVVGVQCACSVYVSMWLLPQCVQV